MLARLGIRTQLWLLVAIAALSVVTVTAGAVYAAMRGAHALESEHKDSLQPLVTLNNISTLMRETSFRLAGVLIDQMPIEGSKNHAATTVREAKTLWGEYSSYAKANSSISPEERALVEKSDAGWKVTEEFFGKLLAAYEKKDKKELESIFEDEWPKVHMAFVKGLEKLIPLKESQSRGIYETNSAALKTLRELAMGVGVISILMLAVFSWLILRGVVGSLVEASSIANRIAEGDLGVRVKTGRRDEIGAMFQSMSRMVVNLEHTVAGVRASSESIATATSEIARGNADLSSRTEMQASSLEEATSNMEQLASTVKKNADSAHQANRLAISASDVAVKGGEVVGQVVQTMSTINDSSRKIVDIISVIDGIAFQTNILALNAAVEAARAGEQGRGFAVVASEVRNLAQRSATAAKEIKSLIGNSVEKVDMGTELVDRAGKTMEEIVASVKRVTDIMSEITAASQEQSEGIAQVNNAVNQMNEATQQNAALVEEAAAAAESLEEQAANLAKAVHVFKLASESADQPSRAMSPAAMPKAKVTEFPVRQKAAAPIAARPAKKVANARASDSEEWEEF